MVKSMLEARKRKLFDRLAEPTLNVAGRIKTPFGGAIPGSWMMSTPRDDAPRRADAHGDARDTTRVLRKVGSSQAELKI